MREICFKKDNILLSAKISANDAAARAALRSLSTVSETYATSNSGNYPADMTALTGATPPDILKDYCGMTVSGFDFTCTNTSGRYTYVAKPASVGTSGTTTFTITAGGVLTP